MFTERLLVLCVPLMVACSDSDNATGQEPLSEMQEREGLASMRAEIETIVGLSGPLSTCRSIALGQAVRWALAVFGVFDGPNRFGALG